MNNNINKTKNNLTIIFTVIVFIVVMFFWILFFSAKYAREINIEKKDFFFLIRAVEKWNLSINDIMSFWNRLNNNLEVEYPNIRGLINYVLLTPKHNIIKSNIRDNITEGFVFHIADSKDFNLLSQSKSFLIKKFYSKSDWNILIVLKKLRYSFLDYLDDIIQFLIMNLLFSLFLYLIWIKFINKAFIPIEENIQDMKDFIHNAWHELKTPIAVIDSNIQIIDDIKVYDRVMTKELKREVIRINSIIDWLIKLSNIDSFQNIENNNLLEIINEVINWFKFQINERKIRIKININEKQIIKSNKNYLYIFISNIIWNSIKYNKQEWSIKISYKKWKLIIKDSWIWINSNDINKIFDRFFKWDKSRNSEWFWIWLSLVERIAKIYKWNIKVNSLKWDWTQFTINMK